jgi:hypothetical protein
VPVRRRALVLSWCTALLIALTLAPRARASEGEGDGEAMHVLPCRPTISCSADLVPPGALEIEAGYAARRVRPGGWIHVEPLLLKLTLVRWLQAQVGSNGYLFTTGDIARTLRYYDDFTFAFKTHFADQTHTFPSLAASLGVSVPSFDPPRDFPFAYDASLWFYASKDIGPLHFDLNGGLNVWEFDLPRRQAQVFGALASGLALPKGFGVMVEPYAFTDAKPIAPVDVGLLLGASYAPSPRVLIDAGIDLSAEPQTRLFTLFAGVTFIPARFWGGGADDQRAASSLRPRRFARADASSLR